MSRALVTGGASGIGAATVVRLQQGGMRVASLDLRPSPTADVEIVADVTSEDDVRHGVDSAAEKLGGLDVVVAAAGVAGRGSVIDTSLDEWDRVFGVNARGVYLTAHAAIPHLRRVGGGAFVAVASQLGLVAAADAAAYCASKGAVVQLTRAMAIDHAHEGIRVNCVCPGPTATPLLDAYLAAADDPDAERERYRQAQAHGRLIEPEEIADAIAYLVSPARPRLSGRRWSSTADTRFVSVKRNKSRGSDMAVITGKDEHLLIGGEWVEARTDERFDVTNPATGDVVGTVPDGSEDDVRAAIDAAAEALEGWKALPAIERARVLRRSAEVIRERKDEIAAVMTAEQGKPLAEAAGEVDYSASFLEWFSGEAERVYGQVVPAQNAANRVLVLRQPIGVVAAITPWNFPAAMMTRKLGPAMAAGCTSVVKPASATPLTAALILRAIEDAGAPPGVVNLVTSRASGMVAETIFSDRRVRKISFTGSTEVGKDLIRLSAGQVKRLSLELGGHAPYLIFDDADLDEAVDGVVASKFRNAGQTCVCANRTYVQTGVYDEFVARLAEKVTRMVVGPGDRPGVTIGPLINESGVEKAEEHVRDAVEHGARLVVGGDRLTDDDCARGSFFAPTVLEGVTPDMLISTEETFGPVAGVARFETEDEAIALANDSVYGLCAYFHTRDYARLLRVAERLDYGIIGANAGIISAPNVPFGGVKESGYGREGGSVGIDEYLDVKYVLVAGVET